MLLLFSIVCTAALSDSQSTGFDGGSLTAKRGFSPSVRVRSNNGYDLQVYNFTTDGQVNISIQANKCINPASLVGLYRYRNGTDSPNSTVGDISADLASSRPAELRNHVLINLRSAVVEFEKFLDFTAYCPGSLRRRQLDPVRNYTVLVAQGATGGVIAIGIRAVSNALPLSPLSQDFVFLAASLPAITIIQGLIAQVLGNHRLVEMADARLFLWFSSWARQLRSIAQRQWTSNGTACVSQDSAFGYERNVELSNAPSAELETYYSVESRLSEQEDEYEDALEGEFCDLV